MTEPPPRVPDGSTPEPESLTGTVIRGAGMSAGGYAIAQALNLAIYVVLARLLVPDEFGVYAGATVVLGIGLLLTDSGLGSAIVQRRDRFEEAASTAVLATIANGVGFSLLALAVAPLLGLFYDDSQVTAVAAVMAGILLVRAPATVPDAILQRRFSFLRRVVIEPLAMIAFGAASIISADAGLGVWSLVIGQYAAAVLDLGLTWGLTRWRPRFALASWAMWRELVAYGRHVFAGSAIFDLGFQADSLIVGRGLGLAPLGQYRYGVRVASLPFQALLAGATYVIFPAFARIATDRERFLAAFRRALRWMAMLAFPLGLGLIPLGVPLAVLAFGETWREAGQVAAAMALFPAGGIVNSMVSEALKAEGRPQRLTHINAVWTGSTLATMTAMIPLGLEAVAAGLSIGAVIGGLYAMLTMRRELGLPVREMLALLVGPAMAAAVMAVALFGLEAAVDAEGHAVIAGIALLAAEATAGALVYLVALRVLSPSTFAELTWALEALRERLGRSRRGAPGQGFQGS